MTKGQIIPRLLHALTHVLCFYDSEWSLFVFHLWREVSLGGEKNIVGHKNYKRVSACGIPCQDMMLDDKLLLKCEGGGLGYEMPNGFPQLCSLNMVFIPSWELRPSVPILTMNTSPLCYPIPSAGTGAFRIQNGILGGVCLELSALSAFPRAKGWCW